MTNQRFLALALLVLVCAVHLVTIRISPVIWQDEVQIVDLGRSTLSPASDWSLNWSASDRPVAFLNYMGPVLQETAYRWLAPSIIGPRLSALLGAVVASGLMFLWLRSRRLPDPPAAVLAALFLINPIFVQGYRGARVDAWVIALMLAACLLLRSAGGHAPNGVASLRAVVAGFLVVIAFFVWPSAIYLAPLVAVELIEGHLGATFAASTVARRGLALVAGALVGAVTAALLAGDLLPVMLADTALSQRAYYRTPFTLAAAVAKARDFLLSFEQSPLVPLMAAAALWFGRSRLLAAGTVVALAAMIPSTIYIHRVAYLMPYFIGLIGAGWLRASEKPGRRWPAAVLTLAILWAAAVSLVARPALALAARSGRDPGLIERAAESMPPFGASRVYLGPWEFYFAGRNLGWKMVRPYGVVRNEEFEQLFTTLDYALVSEEEDAGLRRFFASIGWQIVHEVTLPPLQAPLRANAVARERRYYLYSRWPRQP